MAIVITAPGFWSECFKLPRLHFVLHSYFSFVPGSPIGFPIGS